MKDELSIKGLPIIDGQTINISNLKIDPYPFKANIGVKRINKEAEIPKYNKEGDSGYDLVAMETTIITPGETATIPTGLAFEIPLGLELQIRPRSGLSAKTKIRISLGTGDSNYRGEIKINVDNFANPYWVFNKETQDIEIRQSYLVKTLTNEFETIETLVPDGSIIIHKGQRIAQGVLGVVYKGFFKEKEELSETNRGIDGFGSSGV